MTVKAFNPNACITQTYCVQTGRLSGTLEQDVWLSVGLNLGLIILILNQNKIENILVSVLILKRIQQKALSLAGGHTD